MPTHCTMSDSDWAYCSQMIRQARHDYPGRWVDTEQVLFRAWNSAEVVADWSDVSWIFKAYCDHDTQHATSVTAVRRSGAVYVALSG